MKKVLFLVFLFIFFKVQSQQYYLQFNFSIEYDNACVLETQDGEYIDVNIYNQNNQLIKSITNIAHDDLENSNSIEIYSYSSEIITLDERPYKITAYYNPGTSCSYDCNGSNIFCENLVFNHGGFHDYDYQNTSTSEPIRTTLDATISPVLSNPQPDGGNICPDELIYTSGTPEIVNGLTWYFFNDNNNWEQLENYSNYYPLKYSVEDIIGNDYLSRTGSNAIKLKYKYQYNSSSEILESETIIVNIETCSPELLSFTPTSTSCSYTDDGSFSMILDRNLNTNEKLVASLFFENEFISGEYNLLTQKVTETLIDNGNDTYTYNWPSDTPILAGNYKVRYQTLNVSEANPVWSSLEGTEDGFTIDNPLPVTFSATKLNDVFCNGGSDAKIELEVKGGIGNYKYFLNEAITGIPFTNTGIGTSSLSIFHTISGLPKGTKKIKVQDANGCTEKE
ncbi:SprB repeat-containing protein [uncultured Polaribacter sp.]|uniref:SprB repeat-containing protein n=1 Tax=uncultured Polaribacter sp. TaxID=174711 RepID=UPI0026217283|nr:SprB repeat-containing protein [uncultured Polaribacter sp.]